MDTLSDIYYLMQLIVRQILIFLRDFIFRELTWFTLAEENFDNANSKILDVAPHPATDFFVLFTVCGLLFAFMILPTNSIKNEASNYDLNNIEMISTTFENSSPLWYSKPANSSLISYFHDCNSINPSRDTVPKQQNISHPSFSKCRVSLQSKASNYKVRSIRSRHSHKTQVNYLASQTIGREWLVRRTRSGHVYGKYPI
ncbi:uncharacterized protein LOC112639330 [Camponotus floridanus]|uniref:uncharacterized protein LOC112639330 n=1 Tax=Camponotus floridanus TaxID=104421 RepID=UPI000DC6898B|nr:uncharacterized protein LOC112639330 [Camponotus floridanus]